MKLELKAWPRLPQQAALRQKSPSRDLGSTGERVSVIGVGGWHLALPQVDEKLALRRYLCRPSPFLQFFENFAP
jgi:hypothetical protein